MVPIPNLKRARSSATGGTISALNPVQQLVIDTPIITDGDRY